MHLIAVAASGQPGRTCFRVRQGGASLLEFALVLPLLLLLGFGSIIVGMNLDRFMTAKQVARSLSHMYLREVDFQAAGVRTLVLREAAPLGITESGGPGVIYLSRVVLAESGSNAGQPVVSHRVRFGDPSVGSSSVASPMTVCPDSPCNSLLEADGTVHDYSNDAGAVANLPAGLTVTSSRSVFVGEVFHRPSDLPQGYFKLPMIRSRFYF